MIHSTITSPDASPRKTPSTPYLAFDDQGEIFLVDLRGNATKLTAIQSGGMGTQWSVDRVKLTPLEPGVAFTMRQGD